ncbi:MAG: tetratricopeptide repeat protein [Magnetococcales bacterium]|nr:tetratricopeptide repeat protein [Magnetococcales bacterium]
MNENGLSPPPNQQLTIDEAYRLALDHFHAERYGEADKLCSAIIQAVPNHIDAINLLGVIAQKVNRHELATELFQRTIDIDDNRALSYYNLGTSLYQSGKKDAAVKALKIAIKKEPDNSKILDYLNRITTVASDDHSLKEGEYTAHEIMQKALGFHQSGNLAEAIVCYKKILKLDQKNIGALCNLGLALQNAGKLNEAVSSLEKAIALQPDFAEAHSNLGNAMNQLGELDRAVANYKKALQIKPDFAQAYSNLGNVLKAQGKLDEAVSSYQKAVTVKPDYREAYSNLASTLKEQGKLNEAIASHKKALHIRPDFAQAHASIATILKEQGRLDEAVTSYKKAIELEPAFAQAWVNLGSTLREQGRLNEAIASYKKAIELEPGFAQAHYNLGAALNEQGRVDEAANCYQKAIASKADFAEAYSNLGKILKKQGLLNNAIACQQKAIAIKADFAEAHCNLGNALQDQGKPVEACISYQKSITINPDYFQARLALTICQLPILYSSIEEINRARFAYEQSLAELRKWFRRNCTGKGQDFFTAIGSSHPFYLSYQAQNDLELQSAHGELVCASMKEWLRLEGTDIPMAKKEHDRPLRIGIISGQFFYHSVWNVVVNGLVANLDKSRFTIYGYHTNHKQDAETKKASEIFAHFIQGPLSLSSWVKTIADDGLDLIFYPEIGMDAITSQLAGLRLAPVQAVGWGHPTTSGFPTMDYFLSGELLEPPNAEEHYSEKLVKLPNLGSCWSRRNLEVEEFVLDDFGIPSGDSVVRMVSCGNQFKYLPQYDHIFPKIAKQVGSCCFIFFYREDDTLIPSQFKERLRKAFLNDGLDMDEFVLFLHWQPKEKFYSLLQQVDIYLDSIAFSGFTTAIQVLECALPIVTLQGDLMRNRFASAILQRISVTETVAKDLEEYITIAVDLARNRDRRLAIKKQIAANFHLACDDYTVVQAFEDFVVNVVK